MMTTKRKGKFMSCKNRRKLEKKALDEAKTYFPLTPKQQLDISQVQALNFASIFLKWNNEKNKINFDDPNKDEFKIFIKKYLTVNDLLNGFIIVVTNHGRLIYISDNFSNYFERNPLELLIRTNIIYELIHESDKQKLRKVLGSKNINERFEVFCSWYVTKLKKKIVSNDQFQVIKMSGKSIPNTDMIIALCEPVIRCHRNVAVKNCLKLFDGKHRIDLRFSTLSANAKAVLGFNSLSKIDLNLYDLVHPDDFLTLYKLHKHVLDRKNSDDLFEIVRLLSNYGTYVNFLLSMQLKRKSIECKYQLVNPDTVDKYKNYIDSLKENRILSSPTPIKRTNCSSEVLVSTKRQCLDEHSISNSNSSLQNNEMTSSDDSAFKLNSFIEFTEDFDLDFMSSSNNDIMLFDDIISDPIYA